MTQRRNKKMEGKFFVLYKRDMEFEKRKQYGDRMLFDRCKTFHGPEDARQFALQNLPAVYAAAFQVEPEGLPAKDSDKPYVVAAEYRGSTGYGGSHYRKIDYGGLENEDVYAARNWMIDNYEFVDKNRVGILGWSRTFSFDDTGLAGFAPYLWYSQD